MSPDLGSHDYGSHDSEYSSTEMWAVLCHAASPLVMAL